MAPGTLTPSMVTNPVIVLTTLRWFCVFCKLPPKLKEFTWKSCPHPSAGLWHSGCLSPLLCSACLLLSVVPRLLNHECGNNVTFDAITIVPCSGLIPQFKKKKMDLKEKQQMWESKGSFLSIFENSTFLMVWSCWKGAEFSFLLTD